MEGNTEEARKDTLEAACLFGFNPNDSDFDLPIEKVGECLENKKKEEKEGDEEEEEEEEEEMQEGIQKQEKRFSAYKCPCGEPPQIDPEDLYYKGQPKQWEQEEYRSDYPRELRLKKDCVPKAGKKFKTVDNSTTQPIASFSPVSSKERLQAKGKEEDELSAMNLEKKKKSAAASQQCDRISRDLPPIVSANDEIIVSYLEEHNIQMLFEYFVSLCLLNTPEDPFQYISQLSENLIKGRQGEEAFRQIPRLIATNHVEAMFRMYDRVGCGYISFGQYKNAMRTIGLVKYNQTPSGYLDDEVNKETFIKETNQAIDDLLKSFIFKSNTSC